ncbi:hypothetical protein BD311DRAFT_656397 [Dichomitus squalens]|uniref:Protein kinase domain-containing protein n=1 Tax=Dichomitus squalens TaxID=114155 RepID=A0A4Q9MW87_9APHY|nr:hypothetical protein BD311DRAFT_656397 [Dichomitus squalens]
MLDDVLAFSDPLSVPQEALEKLTKPEEWWRDRQAWLAERGYMLRPRYRPGWTPSWKAHPDVFPWKFEDYHGASNPHLMDAVSIPDNQLVVLKKVLKSFNPLEVEVVQYLSSEALRSDPRNHTVPILEIFSVPDDPEATVLVMPLMRQCDDPAWQTVGEIVAFLTQVFEGLQFMHELHVAHSRDCVAQNIMYDPRRMYPHMFHPKDPDKSPDFKSKARHSNRTVCPVKYYFIDFGLSRRYNPEDGPPREHPIRGGDKSVPEFQSWKGDLVDPFPTDIYYVGNMIRTDILEKFEGVEFLAPLADDMTATDPIQRPTIQEVVRRFDELLKPLDNPILRSRLLLRGQPEDWKTRWLRDFGHSLRSFGYALLRKSAIPLPPSS